MDLLGYTPRYITFDCYGTLTNFQMARDRRCRSSPTGSNRLMSRDSSRTSGPTGSMRFSGEFKLYPQVLRDSWQRVCNRWRIQFRPSDVDTIVDSVRSWGPHPDVPEALGKLAAQYPLVILSNAVDWMLKTNVEQLGVDFYRVFTAEQARAYKPRYQAFEYMLDQLNVDRKRSCTCRPTSGTT